MSVAFEVGLKLTVVLMFACNEQASQTQYPRE